MKKALIFLMAMASSVLHAQMIAHDVDSEYVIYPKARRLQLSAFQIPSQRIPGGVTPQDFSTRLDYNTYYSMVGLMDAYYQRVLAARVFGNEMPCIVTNIYLSGNNYFDSFNYTRYGHSVFGGGTNGVHISDEARDFYINPRYLLSTGYWDKATNKYHFFTTGDVWQVRQNYGITNYASQVRIPGYLPWQLGNIYGGKGEITTNEQGLTQLNWEQSDLRWKIREDPGLFRQACQWFRPHYGTDLLKYKGNDYNYERDLYDCYKGLTSSKIPGNLIFPPGATASIQGGWKESALEALTGSGGESKGLSNVWIEMGRFMGWGPEIYPTDDGEKYDDQSILADVVYYSKWWGGDIAGKMYDTYLEIQRQQAEDLEDSWTNYVLNAYGWPVTPEMPPVSTRIDLGPWVWADIFMNMIDTYFVGNGAMPQPCFSNLWDSAEETAEISIKGRNLAWHYEPSSNTWVVVATNSDTQIDFTIVTSRVNSTSMVADNATYYNYSDKISVPPVGFGWYMYNMSTNYYYFNQLVMERFYNKYSPTLHKRYYPGHIKLDFNRKSATINFYDEPERITSDGYVENPYAFLDEYTDTATGSVSVVWKLARQRGELVPIHRQNKLWYSRPAIYPSPAIEDTGIYEEGNAISLESYSSMPSQLVNIPSGDPEHTCTQQVFRCYKLEKLGGIHDIDDAFKNHWVNMISEMTQIQIEKANWTATDATPCATKIEEVYTADKGKEVMKQIFELGRRAEKMTGTLSFVVPRGTYVIWNADSPASYTVHSEIPFGEDDEEHMCLPVIQVFSSIGNAWDDNTSITNSAIEWVGDAAGIFKFNFNKMKQVPEQE